MKEVKLINIFFSRPYGANKTKGMSIKMTKMFSKFILSMMIVGCMLLTGCNNSNNGTSTSPSDSAPATSVETTSTVTGTWSSKLESGDTYQYLTFEAGELVYGEYDADGKTVSLSRVIGSYTENSDGTASVTVKNGSVSETYTASTADGNLVIEPESSTSATDSYSLSGTYIQAEAPADHVVSSSPNSSASDDAKSSDDAAASDSANSSDSPSDSSSTTASDLVSFLNESTFYAGTDTFLGNAHEGQVTGSFSVSEDDGKIEGTFSVTVEGSSAGSLSITIEGSEMYATNSTLGTYSNYTFKSTSSSIVIAQTDSDAVSEDLLNTISGTWSVK